MACNLSHASSRSTPADCVIVIGSPEPYASPRPDVDGAPAAAADIQVPVSDCRICLSGEETKGTLVMPCACIGSVACTHLSCLERWVAERCSTTCELCEQPYKEQYAPTLEEAMAAARASKDKEQATLAANQQQAEVASRRSRRKVLIAWVFAVVLGAGLACVLAAVVRRFGSSAPSSACD